MNILIRGSCFEEITVIDNGDIAYTEISMPGLGSSVLFDEDVNFKDLEGFDNLNLSHIKSLNFELYTEDNSIDFIIGGIGLCKFTDCFVNGDPNNVEICYGDTVNIGANLECSSNVTFFWDQGLGLGAFHDVHPTETTIYNVSVTDAYGCVSIDTVRVNVLDKPELTLPSQVSVCSLDSVEITANVTGGTQPYKYFWSTGDTTKTIKISPQVSTEISLYVEDKNLCQGAEQKVFIEVLPKPKVSVVTTTADCTESNGSAIASASGGTSPYTFTWNNGFVGSDLINIPSGNYVVTVSDANGCMDEASAFVDEKNCGLIGDFVWEDLNYNGQQDVNEPGISNVMVSLLDESQVPLDTIFTDVYGYYYFNGLGEGDYYVRFYTPNNYNLTLKNIGSDITDSDANTSFGLSDLIQLEKYEKDSTIDAGYFLYASIGDTVWVDTNGNGIQDVNEPGMENLEVHLLDCDGNFISSTFTDNNGKYIFENLVPGNYKIKFILNGQYKFTLANQGNNVALDSDADLLTGISGCEELLSGESNTTYDAGVYLPASIGNFVWEDLNANGIQDSGEPGVAGVGVILSNCDLTPIDTV
ncbi:MAG: SdrD B-like domain-containing protein, partial [Saprospiraceae bacterium]